MIFVAIKSELQIPIAVVFFTMGENNKGIFNEINQLKESMKSLINQMVHQDNVVENLKKEIDALKNQGIQNEAISKTFDSNNPLPTPANIDIESIHPPQVLSIEGLVPHDAIQFSVSLKDTRSENIMLHINPRYNTGFVEDQAVVCTDFKSGFGWGAEEYIRGIPFPAGQPFKLDIECNSDCFKIRVNNQFQSSFAHRQGINLINQIHIKGQINVSGYSLK